MSDLPEPIRWTDKDWLESVHAWIAEQLSRLGAKVSGEITQPHIRAWGTALRLPTDRGCLWFKATVPSMAHESALSQSLSQWVPGRTIEVFGCDPERNWLLMADGGDRLRSIVQAEQDWRLPRELSKVYAGLQKDLAPRAPEMLALGTPDCRLAAFTELYVRLLDDTQLLRIGEEEGLSAVEYSRLQELTPRVDAIARELASFGIPETLQHDDLHWNNVLHRDGELLVFDWGDCSISHPFMSLVVMLRGAANDLDVARDSPEIQKLKEIYLETWALPLTRADLDRACLLADALGRISRSLTYSRLMPDLEEPHRSYYLPSVAGWLQEFLEGVRG